MITFSSIKAATDALPKMGGPVQGEWLFNLTRQTSNNALLCEVGTFYGYVSAVMGHAAKESDRRILMIDHMIGGFCDRDEGASCNYLEVIKNMQLHGVWDRIVPFPMKSEAALELFRVLKPSIELLYLDGSHREDEVYSELVQFDAFIPVGGFLCGDDFEARDKTIPFGVLMASGDSSMFNGSVAGAVWKFFGGNNRYEAMPIVPGSQFGFRKIK